MALLDFLFGSRTKPVPTTSTTVTTSKLPEEIAPFVKEVLGEAQQIYGERREQGYQEFPGETIAPRTPEELAAMEGLRGLVGSQEPYRAEQEARLRAAPTAFTAEQAETFMNPYQQAVIDVAKRRAVEDFERVTKPQFEAQAVQAGGMSGLGTRAGVQAGVLGEALQRQLGDIQAIGQQKAFEDAYKRFGDQVERERVKAGDIADVGTRRFNIGLAERGLQQQLAQEDRAEAQALLNEQFAEFLEREQFPESTLAQYSSFVYGNPFLRAPDTTAVTQGTLQPTSSIGQQLLGLGLTGLNIYGQATGKNPFGFLGFKEGGSVNKGLTSLPVINRRGAGAVDPRLPALNRPIQTSARGLPRGVGLSTNPRLNAMQRIAMGTITPAEIRAQRARKTAEDFQLRKLQENQETIIRQEEQKKQRAALNDPFLKAIAPDFQEGDLATAGLTAGIQALNEQDRALGLVEAINIAAGAGLEASAKAKKEQKQEQREYEKLKRAIQADELKLQHTQADASAKRKSALADKIAENEQKVKALEDDVPAANTKAVNEVVKGELELLGLIAKMDKDAADAAASKIKEMTAADSNSLYRKAHENEGYTYDEATGTYKNRNGVALKKDSPDQLRIARNYLAQVEAFERGGYKAAAEAGVRQSLEGRSEAIKKDAIPLPADPNKLINGKIYVQNLQQGGKRYLLKEAAGMRDITEFTKSREEN